VTAEFKDHFSSAAAGYAAHRPSYPRELAETLAGLSPSRQRAWDAGCGSGQLSTVLAEVFEEVAATDASAAQIASAIPHPRVRYSMAPAEASGLPERSVDCAVAAQAAHWFDLDRYYGEVRRVAKGGGLLALVTYNIMRVTDEVDWVILEFYAGPLEKHWPPERRVVEEGYRSLPFPFPEVKAPPLELHQRWTLRQMVGYVGTWSAVQSLRRSGGQSEFERFESKLEAVWGNPEVVRDVRWPLNLRLGRVEV
jgi:SAM-dependent methyltransferase